ncbi:hypothetical protein MTO96_000413 [Rhipicephalus appendiculatus]
MFVCPLFAAALCAFISVSLYRPARAHDVDNAQGVQAVIRFAQCRASCLDKLGLQMDKDNIECTGDKECNMCWDVCRFFNDDFEVWRHMCTVEELCVSSQLAGFT